MYMKLKYTHEYLQGKKFNGLTYVKYSHRAEDSNSFAHWKCDCGKEIIARIADVALGRKKSCNCFKFRKREKNNQWAGYENISGNYWSVIQKSALERKLNFTINIEYAWDVFLKQNKKCALSGIELKWPTKSKSGDGTASLDRIDSKKGYIEGNIQWVHKDVNFMKRHLEESYFVDICKKIAAYR